MHLSVSCLPLHCIQLGPGCLWSYGIVFQALRKSQVREPREPRGMRGRFEVQPETIAEPCQAVFCSFFG